MRITDFGIAKSYSNNNAKETSGTPGYMAPEVMKGQNHSYTVDFFALGIMGYEFMLGKRPYNGRSRREIKEQMLSRHAQISLRDIPNGWSEDAADFFNKLLQRKPDFRLGYKGIWELKQHRWLKFFPWDKLINKELESPFIPEKKDNFDKKYCEANDSINIETRVRYERYKGETEYSNYFINFTFYRIISEIDEEKKVQNSLNNSIKKNGINAFKKTINKEDDITNIFASIEDIDTDKSNKFTYNKFKKEDLIIKKQNTNIPNKKYNAEKIPNISGKSTIKSISFTMKLSENSKKDNNKNNNNKMINNLDDEVPKQPILLRNNDTLDDLNESLTNKYKNNKHNKNSRSQTPIYLEKRQLLLEGNNRYNKYNRSQSKSIKNNKNNKKLLNKRLMMSHNQYNNYKENIRNLFSKKAKQKMTICSPGYYSKHSLQINCNSHKLLVKRNSNSDFSKSPTGSINSYTKSPKITTSTSTSLQGYKKISKSISPFIKNQRLLRQNNSAKNIHKNFINEGSNNSRINLSNLYNKNYSYVKRIKEMNSFNYNNRMMNNISNIKNKNNKRTNEIISSYSISSSNILKQIRNTNYNKNKVNIINKNNPVFLYKNVNQRIKQNNKISLELELNADSQGFNKYNKINNNKNKNNNNKSKNRKSNSNISIKNNIINKNHSTINIGSMKMAMNGNININVVIKGNNNTTNLINKIEVKKKNGGDIKNRTINNKKFQRSNSSGFLNLKI